MQGALGKGVQVARCVLPRTGVPSAPQPSRRDGEPAVSSALTKTWQVAPGTGHSTVLPGLSPGDAGLASRKMRTSLPPFSSGQGVRL